MMNPARVSALLVSACVAMIGGCAAKPAQQSGEAGAAPSPQFVLNTKTAQIGILSEGDPPPPGTVQAATTSALNLASAIDSHEQIVLVTNNSIDARSRREYGVLFGSLDKTSGNLCADRANPQCQIGRGKLNNSDPEWHASHGYALVRGWRPRARTNRATAAAEGTTFFVQVDESPTTQTPPSPAVHRFVLIEGGPLDVFPARRGENDPPLQVGTTTPQAVLTDPYTYVEVTEDSAGGVVVSGVMELPSSNTAGPGGELRKLVRRVLSQEFAGAIE